MNQIIKSFFAHKIALKKKSPIKMKQALCLCVIALLQALPGSVYAQDDRILIDVTSCLNIVSAIGRFACYEEQTELVLRSGTVPRPAQSTYVPPPTPQASPQVAPAPQTSPTPQVAETPANSVDQFGTESPSAGRLVENLDGEEELIDTIAELSERAPNQWMITLSSGQLWRQVNSDYFRLREGMTIRISPSPFGGSYRLYSNDMRGFIQVERVR